MKHKRSKATDIPQKVKNKVWERDGMRCIICGNQIAMPNSHYIPRSSGGLGIEQNVVTMCADCHHEYDNGSMREVYGKEIREHLQKHYPGWSEADLVYNKFKWLEVAVNG